MIRVTRFLLIWISVSVQLHSKTFQFIIHRHSVNQIFDVQWNDFSSVHSASQFNHSSFMSFNT